MPLSLFHTFSVTSTYSSAVSFRHTRLCDFLVHFLQHVGKCVFVIATKFILACSRVCDFEFHAFSNWVDFLEQAGLRAVTFGKTLNEGKIIDLFMRKISRVEVNVYVAVWPIQLSDVEQWRWYLQITEA